MYYFIGIKGTGMAALALMLHNLGHEVTGSDLDNHFFTEDALIDKGIRILPFDENNIKKEYTVIIGNAFLEDFPEVARARQLCKCYRYHEFLGEFMKDYTTVSICGSHGKTTTTTLCKTMLSKFKKTAYLIGDGDGFVENNKDKISLVINGVESPLVETIKINDTNKSIEVTLIYIPYDLIEDLSYMFCNCKSKSIKIIEIKNHERFLVNVKKISNMFNNRSYPTDTDLHFFHIFKGVKFIDSLFSYIKSNSFKYNFRNKNG